MIGGEKEIVDHLEPLFASIAPGFDAAPRTPGAPGALPAPNRDFSIAGKRARATS